MRQIPMLFSPDMIEALLSGTKTETRRILKPQPETFTNDDGEICDVYPFKVEGQSRSRVAMGFDGHGVITEQKCGAEIDDLIWVRENWRVGAWHYNNSEIAVDYCDGPRKEWLHVDDPDLLHRLIEQSRADAAKRDTRLHDGYYEYSWSPGNGPTRWRPSIHMPKAFSRLTLRVTGFNIERLHDINEEAAIAEGIKEIKLPEYKGERTWRSYDGKENHVTTDPRLSYATLWNDINGDEAWDENPYVSVTKFQVIRKNVETLIEDIGAQSVDDGHDDAM